MKALILCIALSGCAVERQLTPEEDVQIAAKCGQGCVVVPSSLWQQLLEKLRGLNV